MNISFVFTATDNRLPRAKLNRIGHCPPAVVFCGIKMLKTADWDVLCRSHSLTHCIIDNTHGRYGVSPITN